MESLPSSLGDLIPSLAPHLNGHGDTTDTSDSDVGLSASRPVSLSATGPVTARGKQRSRLNAIKHGLRATDGLFMSTLSGFERGIFHELRRQLHEDYGPVTSPEKFLVDRIAIEYLRLFRLYQLEQSATRKSLDDPLAKASVLPHLDRLSRYDWRIERQIRTLHNRLCSHFSDRHDSRLTYYCPKD